MIKIWMDEKRLESDVPLYNSKSKEFIWFLAPEHYGWIIMRIADVKISLNFLIKGFKI